MKKLVGALCIVLWGAGCGAGEEALEAPTGPVGTSEAGLSTPVLNGSIPGLSPQTARDIAVQNFNAVSQWAPHGYPHRADQTHLWAYVPEGFYYIEGHTWIEQCGGRVYASGAFVLEYCFMKSIGP
ncbi:MAG TPA: hypothetical protein VF664_09665 [Cystobacter sp.]